MRRYLGAYVAESIIAVVTILTALYVTVTPNEAHDLTSYSSQTVIESLVAEAVIPHTSEAENAEASTVEELSTSKEPLVDITQEVPTVVETPASTIVETIAVIKETEAPTVEYFPVYTVCGKTMDIYLQQYLHHQLNAYGIGWFMPYAIAQAFQESGFDVNAENVNGLDKGLFQYRTTYWTQPFDIFNPWAQIDCYVRTMARRLVVEGCSINYAISKHNTGDGGLYNPVYVEQVLQWVPQLIQIQ